MKFLSKILSASVCLALALNAYAAINPNPASDDFAEMQMRRLQDIRESYVRNGVDPVIAQMLAQAEVRETTPQPNTECHGQIICGSCIAGAVTCIREYPPACGRKSEIVGTTACNNRPLSRPFPGSNAPQIIGPRSGPNIDPLPPMREPQMPQPFTPSPLRY